jgi:hypothetical protein
MTPTGATSSLEACSWVESPLPLVARGNLRSVLLDRPAAALRRRPLLEGAVLAAGVSWLLEMVAMSDSAQDARLLGAMYVIVLTL